eukprot:10119895-Alexandrium_andersonii.AAC.1
MHSDAVDTPSWRRWRLKRLTASSKARAARALPQGRPPKNDDRWPRTMALNPDGGGAKVRE